MTENLCSKHIGVYTSVQCTRVHTSIYLFHCETVINYVIVFSFGTPTRNTMKVVHWLIITIRFWIFLTDTGKENYQRSKSDIRHYQKHLQHYFEHEPEPNPFNIRMKQSFWTNMTHSETLLGLLIRSFILKHNLLSPKS